MSEENKIEEENTKKLPVKKRYIFTSLAIIGALAAGYFIYDALGYQSTDDAYVETTTVSVYNKNILIKTSIIGMAGRDIDNDISYMYKIDLEVAKKIKEKFALAHKKYASSSEIYELPGHKNIEQLEVSTITMSRIEEILTLAKKELLELTNRQMEYIIITGGVSNMSHFELVAENIFGKDVIIGNVRLIGIRNNKYSSAVGNIVYFINKLKIKGKNYTMVSDTDMEILSSTKKSLINVSNESMLGKVFGYFFGE